MWLWHKMARSGTECDVPLRSRLRIVATQAEPVARLDNVAQRFLRNGESIFIKIDVQEFERKVLDGASVLLKRALGLQLELSLTPLYEGETHLPADGGISARNRFRPFGH